MKLHSLLVLAAVGVPLHACSDSSEKTEDTPDNFEAAGHTEVDDDPPEISDTADEDNSDENTEGEDTATEEEDAPLAIDGVYEGTITVNLTADPLGTGVMMEEACTGHLLANVMQVGEPPIYGTGECSIAEDSIMATLMGTAGPFGGGLSGRFDEDGAPTGIISIEIVGFDDGVEVDWTGRFEGTDGSVTLVGEAEGLLEDLTVEMEVGTLVFDVSYSGGFELAQVRTPE